MFKFLRIKRGSWVEKIKAWAREPIIFPRSKYFLWKLKKKENLARETRRLIVWATHDRLRHHFDLPLMGDNKRQDDHLPSLVAKFFGLINEDLELTKNDKGYWQWLEEDAQAIDDREVCKRVYQWLKWLADDPEGEIRGTYVSGECKYPIQKELEFLGNNSIRKVYREYKKHRRFVRREFRQSKVPPIELDLKSLSPLVQVLSVCFVFGGYGYTSIVYGHWGIPVHQFFLISDYFTVSLEQFQHIVVGILSYAFGVIHERWRSYAMASSEYAESAQAEQRPRQFAFWVCAVSLIMFIVMHIAARMKWFQIPEVILPPAGVALLVVIVFQGGFYWIAHRYFKQESLVACTLLFLAAFSASLYTSARYRIMEIEENLVTQSFEIGTDFKEFSNENSTFIGSNSRYVFLKTVNDDTEIIRLDQVRRISFAID